MEKVNWICGGERKNSGGHRRVRSSNNLSVMFLVIFGWNLSSTSSFCPPYCLCDDIALSVNCHSTSNLRVVPIFLNPQIKYLSLANNQIKDITLSLQFYAELYLLDISQNQIASLGKQNFELLKSLRVLNVSKNSVKVLEAGVFQGLSAMTLLDLTGNQLERVERQIFWNLREIKEIILDRNRLEFLDWELFRGLDTLERISVQYNFIQVIEPSPSSSLSNNGMVSTSWTLPGVKSLDVSSNQLTRVKNNSLVIFGGLKELNLCCNYIHTLETKAFASLNQIERVNLSQNRLGRIPTDSLEGMGGTIRQLDLSSNRISDQIPKHAFRSLFKLETLRLNDNPGVLSIHPDALSDNVNLVNFEADYLSNVTELSGNLLSNKPSLVHFSMKYAQISRIPEELLQEVPVSPVASSLDLAGNPIDCNCSIHPLVQFLQESSEHSSSSSSYDEDHLKNTLEDSVSVTIPRIFISSSNLSQAQYVDPSNNHKIVGRSSSSSGPMPSYLSSIRCQSPEGLAGILIKDLKKSDFSDCFNGEDHFQVMVIGIAAAILSLIFLVVGVKLFCCPSDTDSKRCQCRCRKLVSFCKNHNGCCHRNGKDKELDKADKLFEGLRGDLPATPTPIHNNHHHGGTAAGPAKLILADSPSHHQPKYYSSSNTIKRDNADNGLEYNINGGYYNPRQFDMGHNMVTMSKYPVGGHYHLQNYQTPTPPGPSSCGAGNIINSPPMIVHYEYEYPEYNHHHHHPTQHQLNNPHHPTSFNSKSSNRVHRVKQEPSVLV